MVIWIINGPNLNTLGSREPEIYGTESFEVYLNRLRIGFPGTELIYHQSNWEGGLIDLLQEADTSAHGVVLNAGAYSHTSIAVADAVAAMRIPVIGVHISNLFAREPERKTDLLARHCKGNLSGFGLNGYELAIRALLMRN